jgi:hypothetical protein
MSSSKSERHGNLIPAAKSGGVIRGADRSIYPIALSASLSKAVTAMLFLRVLDFVVGDTMEALDEHHDVGDAGEGDFGGVGEGAQRRQRRSDGTNYFRRSGTMIS